MEEIKQLISEKKQKQIVHPVFKWGQSKTHIFLYVKLSHRFGSPGCLDVTTQPQFKLNNRNFSFEVECIQATQPLVFSIEFQMPYGGSSPELTKDSVGCFTLKFKKEDSFIWDRLILLQSQSEVLNPKIWYELEDLYPKEMKEFFKKLD